MLGMVLDATGATPKQKKGRYSPTPMAGVTYEGEEGRPNLVAAAAIIYFRSRLTGRSAPHSPEL